MASPSVVWLRILGFCYGMFRVRFFFFFFLPQFSYFDLIFVLITFILWSKLERMTVLLAFGWKVGCFGFL